MIVGIMQLVATNKYQPYIKSIRNETFLIYMGNMGLECYVPRLPRKHKSEYVPYIFTENEIKGLFAAADNLRVKEHHANSLMMVVPVLLRTLYSTAIRIGEAINLRNKDIDFENMSLFWITQRMAVKDLPL